MRFPSCHNSTQLTASLILSIGLTLPLGTLMAQTTSLPNNTSLPENNASHTDRYDQVADARGLDNVVGYGRGASFADIDGDGDDDLFVADTDGRLFGAPYGLSMIYVNDGSGGFTPGEFNLDPADFHGTWVGSFADYDNDGDPDLMVGNGGFTNRSSLVLLENRIDQRQGFVNVTRAAGLESSNAVRGKNSWWGVSWADYDNDGWLDVVATRVQGRPLLFHNDGDGAFSEQGEALGLGEATQNNGKNPVWIDYDEDGDQDLYLSGIGSHAFYRNDLGKFFDVTEEVFVEALEGRSGRPAVFATATADFDQDGHEDIYLGRWDSQDYIYFGNGAGQFDRVGKEAGLDTINQIQLSPNDTNPLGSEGAPARREARLNGLKGEEEAGILPYENTMGLGVGDFYDDGFPDIVIGTGDPGFTGADIFLCNLGQRRFERCTDQFIDPDSDHIMTRGHGAVFADIDHDGFTDFFLNLGGHPPFDFAQKIESRETNKLFVRQTEATANAAWLTLSGTNSNRDAIGARVRYGEGDQARYHYLRSTQGFQSQNSMTLLLQLGDQQSVPVIIDWPSGSSTKLTISSGERRNVVEQ
ncbi:MAG: hypothetical protein ACI80L_002625 [Pseudohongiellaceae bacterium]